MPLEVKGQPVAPLKDWLILSFIIKTAQTRNMFPFLLIESSAPGGCQGCGRRAPLPVRRPAISQTPRLLKPGALRATAFKRNRVDFGRFGRGEHLGALRRNVAYRSILRKS